ncbi:MAG: pilus assembly protein PilM [bacterium]|nr:pilus assembly protein PilM [bacterium]
MELSLGSLSDLLERFRGQELEKTLGLRPPFPLVALDLDRGEANLVRLKSRRRGLPLLEEHRTFPLPGDEVPASIFQPVTANPEKIGERLGQIFDSAAARPARMSIVLPDNLAKVTLLTLPEKPASAKQMDELVKAKMRRAVPFRLEEASLSYQVLTGDKRDVTVLVVLVRKALIERLEQAFEGLGMRAGLIDICTPNLVNLCRSRIDEACGTADAALLNCARNYFSLVIFREGRLIFFRCKTFGLEEGEGPNGMLAREVANSFAYYREKLRGKGVGAMFVRSVTTPFDEIREKLVALGCERVEPVDPRSAIDLAEGVRLDANAAQHAAAAIGATAGRA